MSEAWACFQAASAGDACHLKALLAAGADINEKDAMGYTNLHKASVRGIEACARVLIDAGADIDAITNRGQTSLALASLGGHVACTQMLIDSGAEMDAADEYGSTALHSAAEQGHAMCVRALVAAGANMDAVDLWGNTVLHTAVEGGEMCVQMLVDAGANLEAINTSGRTPLQTAFHQNPKNIPCMAVLAAAGANPWTNGWNETVPPPVATAARAYLAALQPDAVARARQTRAGDAPPVVLDLLRAYAALSRIEKAFLGFREDLFVRLAAAKARQSLGCIEYRAISTAGREIAFRETAKAAAEAVLAAEASVEEARARQQSLVDTRLGPDARDS